MTCLNCAIIKILLNDVMWAVKQFTLSTKYPAVFYRVYQKNCKNQNLHARDHIRISIAVQLLTLMDLKIHFHLQNYQNKDTKWTKISWITNGWANNRVKSISCSKVRPNSKLLILFSTEPFIFELISLYVLFLASACWSWLVKCSLISCLCVLFE